MHERAAILPGDSRLARRNPPFGTRALVTEDTALSREFEALLVECSTLAFRVAYGVLRHREDAEDVAQDAFAKAYCRFHQLRDRERFRAWLVRTTWRTAIDRYRANRRRFERELPLPIDSPGSDSAEALERAERLWQAIEALPEKLRVTLVLAAILGHNISEVAALLEVPEGTVKSRLFLARQQLKERLS
jgi:RNA polymerase sigma-70 factor, ECF subfamily